MLHGIVELINVVFAAIYLYRSVAGFGLLATPILMLSKYYIIGRNSA